MDLQEITLEREKLQIQLEPDQLNSIINTIGNGCNLLIFGLGNDTPFWLKVNMNGRTIFIENSKLWADKVMQACPEANCLMVKYGTKLSEYQELLDKPEKLTLELNDEIRNTKWDVILVDAPRGYEDEHPGRMKSIYEASNLVKKGGHIFVHDCNRTVEKVYTDKYLRPENLVEEIRTLRHYIIK